MPRGYSRERTNIHNLHYHFIWCPKYRKKVLTSGVADRFESLIEEKADELELEILKLAIQPDHVHLFITGASEARTEQNHPAAQELLVAGAP